MTGNLSAREATVGLNFLTADQENDQVELGLFVGDYGHRFHFTIKSADGHRSMVNISRKEAARLLAALQRENL